MEPRTREGPDDARKQNTDTQRQSGRGLSGGSGGEGILSDGALSSVGVSTARTLYSLSTPFLPWRFLHPSSFLHTLYGDIETAVEQWLLLKCLRRPRRQSGSRRG